MQSPQKLQARLDELLGPPGPDVDPMELTLRSVVALVGPHLQQLIEAYTPEMLDSALEHVALWFLAIRSDGVAPSLEFIRALGQLEADAAPVTDATIAEPALPAATPPPDDPAPVAPDPPEAAPPAPDPSPAGAPAPDASAPTSSTSSEAPPQHPPAPPWG